MQPAPMPPMSPRARFGLILLVGALAIAAIAGVGGYLAGHAGLADATILVSVTNRGNANLTSVQVSLNDAVQATLSIPAGETVQTTLHVTLATANGAYELVSATASTGPRDSTYVYVSAAQTYSANLQLG